jgi:hypothetical protein
MLILEPWFRARGDGKGRYHLLRFPAFCTIPQKKLSSTIIACGGAQ